jgi:hypothetical protein
MTAVLKEATIPAFPLGRPVDGRERFGMTHEMARVYRWLVAHRPHDGNFAVDFREAGDALGIPSCGTVHYLTTALVERGWLKLVNGARYERYQFVHPVKVFRAP